MKNTASLLITLALILSTGLACSLVGHAEKNEDKNSSGSGKSLEDRGVDIVVGEKKIGVPECDEVIDFFNKEVDNPDDGFVTKAVKKTILNQLKDQFRQAIEENKTDKKELAKVCKDFKQNLEQYKQESENQ
jgi:hypothetical protein